MIQIIFIVLFFAVIFVLVILAVYGSFREKRKKRAIDFEKDKIRELTRNDRLTMMITLGLYIEFINNFLNEHDPLKGSVSLGSVNEFGTSLLNEFFSNEDYRKVFKDEIRAEELKEHFENLKNTKPSNWMQQEFVSLNILKAKIDVILNDPLNKEIIEKVTKEYEMKRSEFFNNR